MTSFTGRLRTFMLFTFFIAMAAIIAMFFYSIKYSTISRLEIEYFGTLNIRKYFHQSASLTNSSENSASTTLSITSDSINSLQAGLRSNNSQQMFKTKESEIKNYNFSNSISNSDLTNQSVDGFKATVHHKLGKNDEQSGFSTRSNQTHGVQDENLCPKNSSTLVGRLLVNASVPKMEEVEKEMAVAHGGWVSKGGCWKPTECNAIVKMALIIPYRNRYQQLSIFVRHMHPLLRKQNVDYRIFVIEQAGQTPFNRAMLFNIGFNESLKIDQYECFIFHDVDLIPEDDRNEYSCPSSPRHMSVAVDKFNYLLPYNIIFGGAGSFTKEHFELINGFSNQFWGWGGEDDDLYRRITAKELKLKRPPMQVGRYKMLKVNHFRSHGADPNRVAKIKTATTRMRTDGINSLKYTVQQVTEFPLYTLVTADVKDAMKT